MVYKLKVLVIFFLNMILNLFFFSQYISKEIMINNNEDVTTGGGLHKEALENTG